MAVANDRNLATMPPAALSSIKETTDPGQLFSPLAWRPHDPRGYESLDDSKSYVLVSWRGRRGVFS
jgi:hypothetical protein